MRWFDPETSKCCKIVDSLFGCAFHSRYKKDKDLMCYMGKNLPIVEPDDLLSSESDDSMIEAAINASIAKAARAQSSVARVILTKITTMPK